VNTIADTPGVRVVLVEAHRMVREALRGLLVAERDFAIVGEAGDGRTALELAARVAPDVLVLDVSLPDLPGPEVARRLRTAGSRARLLALAVDGAKRCVQEMLKAGADGYLTKDAAADELPRAIRALAAGQAFLSPEVARTVVDGYETAVARIDPVRLGPRERAVLRLITEGAHSPAIAMQLGISVATVEVHRRNIMRKLDLHSVAALTRYAIREGLASL
jgi:two-component system NarL family response regulator